MAIRDRQNALSRGRGADAEGSGWRDLFEAAISDADFRDGRREYSEFAIASKEELFFMRTLAANMDVKRVPHLRGRLRLDVPRASAGRAAAR